MKWLPLPLLVLSPLAKPLQRSLSPLSTLMKHQKELGRIAYESTAEGGKANWGAWEKAPEVVRRVHREMAKAVESEVTRRLKAKGWCGPLKQERLVTRALMNVSV